MVLRKYSYSPIDCLHIYYDLNVTPSSLGYMRRVIILLQLRWALQKWWLYCIHPSISIYSAVKIWKQEKFILRVSSDFNLVKVVIFEISKGIFVGVGTCLPSDAGGPEMLHSYLHTRSALWWSPAFTLCSPWNRQGSKNEPELLLVYLTLWIKH